MSVEMVDTDTNHEIRVHTLLLNVYGRFTHPSRRVIARQKAPPFQP